MHDDVRIFESDQYVTIYLNVESAHVLAIGDRLQALHELAYMNGYNWEAVLLHYLKVHKPAFLEDLDSDPEAGSYVLHYPKSAPNQARAEALGTLIRALLEQPEQLETFVKENGAEISWD